MHKSNGTHPPESPFPLSTEERLELRAQSQKPIRQEEERRSQLQEDQLALRVNPDATITLSGRRIQNNRAKSEAGTHEQRRINQIFDTFALGGFSLQSITKIASALISLTGAFGASVAANPAAPDSVTDARNIYDVERVTHDTYNKLKQESLEIATQEQLVAQIEDPVEYMRELQNFAERANALDMRPHPVTGDFIHCHARVQAMEQTAALNKALIEPPIYGVMVFRPRIDIGHDISGLNVVVADHYNNTADETLGRINTAKVETRPIQAPHLQYIG